MEIKELGYQSLRSFIVNDWNKVIIRNTDNAQAFELDGLNWIHEPLNKELKFEMVIKGSDVDINTTASKLELYDSNGNIVSEEEFEPFTFSNLEDELTITHTIEVPRV
ncbi:hypothetical protein BTR22_05230 [Alkalihalophilus pseudofirmus]|uniref:hypothetical protein n=1 Tax=Alkalihalophilus pseudofirmus TaxID=79885 RepID=UPI000951381B|nr:hypothetical protein BTR22_05230 [Alkalihalophilus pseudofirmus]